MPRNLPTYRRIWWITLVAKLLLGIFLPISFDESYYWIWSHHPQLSYFDHPGMVSWLFTLGHFFEPFATAVRTPFILMGHLLLLVWFKILDHFEFSDRQKLWWLILALASPLVGFGSIVGLPDIPLLFFSALALLYFLRSLQSKSLLNYFFFGLSLGLGFCSKYHIVISALAVLLWLSFEKTWPQVSKKGFVLTFVAGILASLPVLLWNYKNNWGSFTYQIDHGLGQKNWNLEWTLGYFGGELLLIFPTVIWFSFKAKTTSLSRILTYWSWTPLVFFFISSFRGPVELNWPITAVPAILALAVMGAKKFSPFIAGVILWVLAATFVVGHIFFPFLKNPTDKLNEVHYFDPVKTYAETYEPLYVGSYQMASMLTYIYKKPFYKLWQISRHDFFDELMPNAPAESHYFILKEYWVPFPAWQTTANYSIVRLKEIPPKFELYEVTRK